MAVSTPTATDGTEAAASARPAAAPRRRGIPRPLFLAVVWVAIGLGHCLIWLAGRLSRKNAHRVALWITRRLDPLTRRRRHANLRRFFRSSGKNAGELQQLDDAHLRYLARMRADTAQHFGKTAAEFRENIRLEGEEHLRAVLARGRGALLVSGHTATWWAVPAMLAVSGYPVTVVFTPIRFKSVKRKLLALAQRYNVRVAFLGRDALKAVRRAAKHDEIVYLSFDVAVRMREMETVRFGDAWMQVDPGPAILAVRHAMPALQASCVLRENNGATISIYPPDEMEITPQNFPPADLCRHWMQRLEHEVRAHPEQWWPWGYLDLLEKPPAGKGASWWSEIPDESGSRGRSRHLKARPYHPPAP